MNKEIPTERLAEYYQDYAKDNCDATEFWSYVAGREHGKEVAEPIKPVKAEWNLYREDRSISAIAFQSIWLTLYPQGKPVYEK